MLRNAKVGDRVVDVTNGEGVIVDINLKKLCPIRVQFSECEGDSETYRVSGIKYGDDKYPSLFYADGYVPPVPGREPERLPDFKFDEVILVKFIGNTWVPRHFKEFNAEGHAVCFDGGCSSKTVPGYTSPDCWIEFKKYEE